MLKHILLSAAMLAAAPAVAHADDLESLCTFARKASADDQVAYGALRSHLWTQMECELPLANDMPDRYDSSMIVHVARIIQTFGESAEPEMMSRYHRDNSVVAYSISKLDRAKFDKEILKVPAGAKKLLGAAFDLANAQAKSVNAWRAKQTKAGAKKVWQTGWDDAIVAVDKDWGTYGADIRLAITALDKARDGEPCPDVRSRLFAVVKQAAPKSKQEADGLVHRIDFEMLVAASARCAVVVEDDRFAAMLGNLSEQLRLREHFEGPAAQVASVIVGRYKEVRDRGIEGDTVEPRDTSSTMAERGSIPQLKDYYGGSSDGGGHGLVKDAVYGEVAAKKPAKAKGWVTVTFKKIMVTDREVNCTPTNRVSRIDEDGNLQYEQNCSYGKSFKTNVAPWAVDVPSDLAESIKPGNYVLVSEIENGTNASNHRLGIPVELYADKSRKVLIGLLGMRWK